MMPKWNKNKIYRKSFKAEIRRERPEAGGLEEAFLPYFPPPSPLAFKSVSLK